MKNSSSVVAHGHVRFALTADEKADDAHDPKQSSTLVVPLSLVRPAKLLPMLGKIVPTFDQQTLACGRPFLLSCDLHVSRPSG